MYLSIGNDMAVRERSVIGIFDLDNTTTSKRTREFLNLAEKEGQVVPCDDLPKSFIVTAEYGMLPRATHTRTKREAAKGQQTGRSAEIQRLIGRSLRAAIDLDLLGPRTITLDCDVLQADGGTRTASISGGFVALAMATRRLRRQGLILQDPVKFPVAAISVGIVDGQPVLDLDYAEDSHAEVDMNVIGTATGALVEVQGTAEGKVFERRDLDRLLDLAFKGIAEITQAQINALG